MCNQFLGSGDLLGQSVGSLDVVDDRNKALWVCSANVDSHKYLPFKICVKLARECVHHA
jgi:hypothetical protein